MRWIQAVKKRFSVYQKSFLRHPIWKKKLSLETLDAIEEFLLEANFGMIFTQRFLKQCQHYTQERTVEEVFLSEFSEFLKPHLRKLPLPATKPFVFLCVGINGGGKTTTLGKLAHFYQKKHHTTCLATTDIFRASAVDQLALWAQKTNTTFFNPGSTDPGAIAYQAYVEAEKKGSQILLIDTAGRLHTQTNLMDQLKKIKTVLQKKNKQAPHEIILVLDSHLGLNAITQAHIFHETLNLSGLILTKIEGTNKPGFIAQILSELKIPLFAIGFGEKKEDLVEASLENILPLFTGNTDTNALD